MTDKYILNNSNEPIPAKDVLEWGKWFEWATANKRRVVRQTTLKNGYWVSTVFLGIDHSFGFGKPLLFETMVFTNDHWKELDTERYSTWDESLAGHKKMVMKWSHKKDKRLTKPVKVYSSTGTITNTAIKPFTKKELKEAIENIRLDWTKISKKGNKE